MTHSVPPLRLLHGGAQGAPDEDAFAEPPVDLDGYFRRYSSYVAAISLRMLGRDDEVDDVVQEVFVAAWRGLRGLREPEAIRGWLATVTVRRVGRRLRMRRLRRYIGLDERPDYAELAVGGSQERATLLAQVYRVLDELPTELRLPWTLQKVEGESLDRIAELCGCSLATAKRRIAQAHTRIEEAVQDA